MLSSLVLAGFIVSTGCFKASGYFEENVGQWNPAARFHGSTPEVAVWLTGKEALFQYERRFTNRATRKDAYKGHVVRVEFVGARPTMPTASSDTGGVSNYILGDRGTFLGAKHYDVVDYPEIYRGISVQYKIDGANPRFDFHLKPGANVSDIRIRYEGVKRLSVSEEGVRYETSLGPVFEGSLQAFQVEAGGLRRPVEVKPYFNDGNVSFRVGKYDASRELVIDPTIYATLFGGRSGEDINDLVALEDGSTIYCGTTTSSDLPTTIGAYDRKAQFADGNVTAKDLLVAKLRPDGSKLKFCTYIGGSGDDEGVSLALMAGGDIALGVNTTSGDMPSRYSIGYQFESRGNSEGYVAILNSTGSYIDYASYIGGSANDHISALSVDPRYQTIAIAGWTTSADYPCTSGAYQRSSKGAVDAFVSVLNNRCSVLGYSSLLSGSADDEFRDVRISYGALRCVGRTKSDFNLTGTNATQKSRAGAGTWDGILADFYWRPNGQGFLQYMTYFGGSGDDSFNAIGPYDYCVGETTSLDLPTTTGVAFPTTKSRGEAFIGSFEGSAGWSSYRASYAGLLAPFDIDKFPFGSFYTRGVSAVTGRDWVGIAVNSWGTYYDQIVGSDTFSGRAVVIRFDWDLGEVVGTTVFHAFGGSFDSQTAITALAVDEMDTIYAVGNTKDSGFKTSGNAFQNSMDFGDWAESETHGFVQAIGMGDLRNISVKPQPILSGMTGVGTVYLTAPAPLQGARVGLDSEAAELLVPEFVAVPAGQKTATFEVRASPISAPEIVQLRAEYGGIYIAKVKLAPPQLETMEAAAAVFGGASFQVTVSVRGVVPPGGTLVRFESSNPEAFPVPRSVRIPMGQSRAALELSPVPVNDDQMVTLTSKAGSAIRSVPVLLMAPDLLSLKVSPSSLVGGTEVRPEVTVLLSSPAPPGMQLTIESSRPNIAKIESGTVDVPAGATLVKFLLKGTAAVSDKAVTATISARYRDQKITGSLIITPIP